MAHIARFCFQTRLKVNDAPDAVKRNRIGVTATSHGRRTLPQVATLHNPGRDMNCTPLLGHWPAMCASFEADREAGANTLRENMRDRWWRSRAVALKWLAKCFGEAGERTSSGTRLGGSKTALRDA